MIMNPAWETSPKQSDPGHTKPIPLKKKKKTGRTQLLGYIKAPKNHKSLAFRLFTFPKGL